MRKRIGQIATFLLAAAGLAASAGAQEAPHLLADVNRTPHAPFSTDLREEPADFFNLGGRLLFSTADPDSLDQAILWSTDGSTGGTRQVSTTLCTSACQRLSPLAVQNGLALLRIDSRSDDVFSLTRLGRTDGTPGGTFLLTGDFLFDETPLEIFPLPGLGAFLFPGCPPGEACRLWQSDGTRAGTGIFAGTDGLPFVSPHAFSLWHGRLYFVAVHGDGGEEGLWSTDGTPAGTLFLHAVNDRGDVRAPSAASSTRLFFTSGEAGEDLWATDGTPAGTRQVADFPPPPCDVGCFLPDVDSMTAVGDRAYFETHRAGHAIEIWESDGTPEGTLSRIELPPQVWSVESFQRIGGHWLFLAVGFDGEVLWTVDDGFVKATRLRACGGEACPMIYASLSPPGARPFVFAGFDALHGIEPWTTDGTAAGTRRLADICPGTCPGISLAEDPIEVVGPSGTIWFRAFSLGEDLETDGNELWRTDGTAGGTRRIAGHFAGFGFLNGLVYYGSSFGNPTQGHLGSELWATDGTAADTHRIASLRRFEPGSAPSFQPFQEGALILTSNADGQAALWRSDGTPPGTFPLHDFSRDAQSTYASFLGRSGAVQLLSLFVEPADSGQPARSEIWRTDGTARGTRFVAGLPASSVGTAITWRDKLVFSVGSPRGCAFWSSDGTAAGTHPIPVAAPQDCPWLLTALGSGFLYSAASGNPERTRLFVSDGTSAGTREIARFGGIIDLGPLRIGGTLFFRVVSGVTGELWQTDGSAAGTHPASTLIDPSAFQEFDGSLYLTAALAADHDAGRALFRVPLSGGPPIQLARLFQYSESVLVAPVQFAPLGDRLLFTVQDFGHGFEAWSTDGTPEGTRRIHTFQPVPGRFQDPELLAATADRVFFAAGDGVHGRELWESDGTPEGTRMVTDLAPGGFSSLPAYSSFAVTDRFLFFAADDSKTGLEPWALQLEQP